MIKMVEKNVENYCKGTIILCLMIKNIFIISKDKSNKTLVTYGSIIHNKIKLLKFRLSITIFNY
jgi:hypothetical protein